MCSCLCFLLDSLLGLRLSQWTPPGDFGREPKSPKTPTPTYDQRGTTVTSPKGHVIRLALVVLLPHAQNHTQPLGWASLNSKLSTQPPTDLPTPKSPQMQTCPRPHSQASPQNLVLFSCGQCVSDRAHYPVTQARNSEASSPSVSSILISNSPRLAHLPLKQPFTAPPPSGPNARA